MRTEARRLPVDAPAYPRSRAAVFLLLAAAGLFWDLYTKHVVFTDLGYPAGALPAAQVPGEHVTFAAPNLIQGRTVRYLRSWVTFELYTSFNHGALWGMGQGLSWVFASLSLVATGFVLYWLFVHGAARSLWLTVSLALIMAGTLGNLYDRLGLHGYTDPATGEVWYAVRDFLLFTFGDWPWHVFNFADVFLVTGAIMLVVQSFLVRDEATDEAGEAPAAAPLATPAGAKVDAAR